MNQRNNSYSRITNIPDRIYQEAEARAANLPIYDRSHRQSEANEIGCLGEVLSENWMALRGISYTAELTETTHDYRVGTGITVDVKTKDRTVVPRSDFDNSAPLYNHTHQRPEYFLFISLCRDKTNDSKDIRRFHSAYILGSISYEELNRVGIPFLKGEKDWRNGTKFWTDCLNIEMWQLITLKETAGLFKGEINHPSSDAEVNIKVVNEMKKRIESGEYKPRDLPKVD